jgi:hypothetical protein
MLFGFLVPLVVLGAKPLATEELNNYRSSNIKVYAFEQVLDRWGEKQWYYFNKLIERESNWNHLAQNKHSTAFGYGQFLSSTWKSVGCEKTEDKYIQIDCTIKYIALRYKQPSNAIRFHDAKGYY